MTNILMWARAAVGDALTIPLAWMAIAFGAMAAVIACLWRDNLKLRAALLKEKEEKVELCQGILQMVKGRTRRYDQ
jgi:hypothetical protein